MSIELDNARAIWDTKDHEEENKDTSGEGVDKMKKEVQDLKEQNIAIIMKETDNAEDQRARAHRNTQDDREELHQSFKGFL